MLMTLEARHAVLLSGQEIGVLHQRGDHVRFSFLPSYWENPERQVLGLWFEDRRNARIASSLRLPPWFANLLPEGHLRNLIAVDRKVSGDREMELLAQVGHDLPGAVQILDGKGEDVPWLHNDILNDKSSGITLPVGPIKFSLAGVGLKFSMMKEGERFTIPGSSDTGSHWIVKLPDARHRAVPQNEFAVMQLAKSVGIEVPEIHSLHREEAFGIPDHLWPTGEEFAFAIKRFDRGNDGSRIHIEDFAQIRGFYSEEKYRGAFETIAALCYRGEDEDSLCEFVRRFVFNVIVGNGDAHLKNWSMIYPDGRSPRLSPAYDIVSTIVYNLNDDIGLKFGGSKRFDDVLRWKFKKLEQTLGVPSGLLVDIVDKTCSRISEVWDPQLFPDSLEPARKWIEKSISRYESNFFI